MKIRGNKVSQRSRKSKHKQSFRPNFIHSLDSTIMRMFLYKYYRQIGKKWNPLHDCVMLHPNDVDIFYKIVTEIYCSYFMKTLTRDLVFSCMKSDTRGQVLCRIIEIEKEFISNMDNLELTPSTFDPRKCYRYEGAK
jgi:DNA-directed RNA polymerase